MKSRIILVLYLLVFHSMAARSADFLAQCDSLAADKNYSLLIDFIAKNDTTADLCQRLNNREFVYTSGRNFMYCKSLDGRSISCEPDVGSTWYPDLSPEIRFVGKNGKNYVLFKTERLSHGHYSDGYYVFFLVPKKINSKGYVIYSFQNSGAFDNSDREGKCVDEKDVEVGVHLNPPFEIINEGRSNVTVRFDREITNCKTGERFKTENAYVWQEFGFKESITRSTKIN